MKHQLLRLALAVTLLLCVWPAASIAQAAIADSVLVWGNNDSGQATVPLAAQSGVTTIAAGWQHTVALRNDGSVVAWGGNDTGGTTVPVEAQSGVTAVAAGGGHTVALKNDGAVVAWGLNDYGQTTIPLAAQNGVSAIAAGSRHTVALKADGTVVAWGQNVSGETTVPVAAQSGVTAIAAGWYYTVALKADGTVVAWGLNDYGQTTIPLAAQSGVSAIAAGSRHIVALRADGSVVAWGQNVSGETMVPAAAQSGVTAIAAGWGYTVALKNDGSIVAWGNNEFGQRTVPVAAQSGVSAIAAGDGHTVALVIPTAPSITTEPVDQAVNLGQSASFTVVATGYPLNYQWRKDGVNLAGATSATYRLLPFALTNDAGHYTVVVSNSVGSVTSAPPAVLTVSAAPGTVVAWGIGHITVPIAAQSGVTAIATHGGCGFGCNAHSVALKYDGTVVAWGGNGYGQVTGTPTNDFNSSVIASPVTLGGQVLGKVVAIAAGNFHTVALKDDGSVVAWGYNGNGAVTGTPTIDPSKSAIASPVTLEGHVLGGVTAIAAGWDHTVALKNDGSVVVWGSATGHVPIAAQSGVTAIAAGPVQTVALIGGVELLPSLKARPNGSELILSWPTNAPGFTLQSTLDLTPPVTWLDSTSVPAVIDAHFTLTNTNPGGARYYRLRKM